MEKCRACLKTSSLFFWNKVVAENVTYKDIFFHVTHLQKRDFVEIKSLCETCGEEIKNIYNFIRKATDSERSLRKDNYHKTLKEQKTNSNENQNEVYFIKSKDADQVENTQLLTSCIERDDCNEIEFVHNTEEVDCSHMEIEFELVNVDSEEINVNISSEFLPEECVTKTITNNKRQSKICEYCKKEFKTYSTKKRHISSVHEHNERLLCDVCPRTFRDIWSLAKHKKIHEENRQRNFFCGICDMKFLTSTALRGHEEIHDGNRQKKYPCDQCEKAFFQKGALNVHKRIHTGQLVQCEICKKRYPRLVDLEIHMRNHTGEMPYKCAKCQNVFKYRCTLYKHIRKAHFGFIYKCSYCSKQFKDQSLLIEHKMQHESFRYKCALCDKESAKKYKLKCHIREIHNVVDTTELEQLVISTKSENIYRKMRKFENVEYKQLTIEKHAIDGQTIEQEYIEELQIEQHTIDKGVMVEHLEEIPMV